MRHRLKSYLPTLHLLQNKIIIVCAKTFQEKKSIAKNRNQAPVMAAQRWMHWVLYPHVYQEISTIMVSQCCLAGGLQILVQFYLLQELTLTNVLSAVLLLGTGFDNI